MKELTPFFADRSSISRSVADQMDKLMNEMFGKDFFPGALARGSYPKMNIYDGGDALHVDAYVPDMPKDKINLEVNESILTIKGESNQDQDTENGQYYCREVSRRAFSRSIRLPDNVESNDISAKLENGMLKIVFPYKQKEEEKTAKTINIE